MIKIGLTGNIASGKSEVTNIIKNLGFPTICADSICHELLLNDKKTIEKIKNSFKNEDIITNNIIDRKKLGIIVFSDKEKKTKLENIIHPEVILKIKEFFENSKNYKFAFADVPLLFENKLSYLFDKTLLIYADDNIRFERIRKRNNFEDGHIKKIMNSQLSQEEKLKKSDFSICNNYTSINELKKDIEKFIYDINLIF